MSSSVRSLRLGGLSLVVPDLVWVRCLGRVNGMVFLSRGGPGPIEARNTGTSIGLAGLHG